MKLFAEPSRYLPFIAIVALIAIGVHTSFVSNGTPYNYAATITIIIYVSPLLFVAFAVAVGSNKPVALFSAYFALLVGGYIEYAYYSSSDPSKAIMLGISLIAYWISAFVALFSLLPSKP